jgi:hypothetical protein
MHYEVDLIPMGFMKSDPESMTSDENEWNDPDKPDSWNVLIMQYMGDDTGVNNIISDLDFPPEAKAYAESNYHMMQLMIDYSESKGVAFGSVPNPHVTK